MNKQIITFSADEQNLVKTGGTNCYASNIVSYIEAHFDLGENWSGYDSVRAVWSNDNNMTVISTVLDSNGHCVVPFEVLKTIGVVKVNLVGSISVSGTLTDRLTTFPCEALTVARKAKIGGSETAPITPSQFEQFIAIVISEVEKVTGMTAEAETLPAGSSATARYENGVLYLGIPQGIQGERGETGEDGNGIAQVLYNSDYSITFVFTNGERFTTPSLRGETGPQGQPGQDGRDGTDGADGVTPSLSVGTVTTLPSTEDAYVTRRGTDENPVFDFGIPQGPKGDKGDTGEVSLEQLSDLLPTDTASGAIASFPDGQSVIPALSVKAEIDPIQDLHGYDKPWSGGAGVNILDPNLKFTAGTYYGVTLSTTDGYSFSLSGTATDSGNISAPTIPTADCVVYPAGTYTSAGAIFSTYKPDGSWYANRQVGTWTADEPFIVRSAYVQIVSGATPPTGNRFLAMAKGSTAPTSWTPYSNICPISGRTECVTEVCGKNLFDKETIKNIISDHDYQNGAYYCDYIDLIPNTTVTVSFNAGTTSTAIILLNSIEQVNGSGYLDLRSSSGSKTFTTDASGRLYIGVLLSETDANFNARIDACNIQIEVGSSASTFEPYNGTTYTTALGRTVYEGEVEIVGGVLTDKMGMVDLGTLNWTLHSAGFMQSNGITSSVKKPSTSSDVANVVCSALETVSAYSIYNGGNGIGIHSDGNIRVRYDNMPTDPTAFKTAMSGAQLCYELATPQTYQLTPTEIALLKGQNNVWTDSGEVEVTYKADVELYIGKKLG